MGIYVGECMRGIILGIVGIRMVGVIGGFYECDFVVCVEMR